MKNSDFEAVQKAIAKGVSWLALFRVGSQIGSWFSTIYIARILVPSDYGLMGMATFLTGYAEIFAELGLGSAIIQRKENTNVELSSLFWFTCVIGIVLALACFPAAYLTAYIMKESRLIPLTISMGVIFLFSSMRTVPLSILKRNLSFKKLGLLEVISSMTAIIAMIFLAKAGMGVWTLVIGRILRQVIYSPLLFLASQFKPKMYCSVNSLKPFVSFGAVISFGRSLFYLHGKVDVFFAGRNWVAPLLGLYEFSRELASIPTDKVMPLMNEAAYPAFSKLKHGTSQEFNRFYLRIIKILAFIFLPVYVAGSVLSKQLILALLGPKWNDAIPLFPYFCIIQIFVTLSSLNAHVLTAKGKPSYSMYFYSILTIVMGVSYYMSAPLGILYMVKTKLTFTIICLLAWQIFTLKKMKLSLKGFTSSIKTPLLGAIAMVSYLLPARNVIEHFNRNSIFAITLLCLSSSGLYLIACYVFEKDFYRIIFDHFKTNVLIKNIKNSSALKNVS